MTFKNMEEHKMSLITQQGLGRFDYTEILSIFIIKFNGDTHDILGKLRCNVEDISIKISN